MAKGFIPISDMLKEIKGKQTRKEIDRLHFWQIFLFWTALVVLFGLLYFFLVSPEGRLQYTATGNTVSNVWDTIYFSFVSATTTGFGDIVPRGAFKILAVIEVVLGLILLAVVTSKLVSLKQDAIMSEIYHLSLRERINRFRDNLLLYRQHLSDMMVKIEENTIKTREVREMYHFVSQFHDTLREVITLLDRSDRNRYTKDMDRVDIELLSNSIVTSFERSAELLQMMNEEGLDWEREVTIQLFDSCISRGQHIMDRVCESETLSASTRKNLRESAASAISDVEMQIPEGHDSET